MLAMPCCKFLLTLEVAALMSGGPVSREWGDFAYES
jgi:hypothetical protein